MKKVLIVGFGDYDQKLYPHLYEVIEYFKEKCDLTYYGFDRRGNELYELENVIKKLFKLKIRYILLFFKKIKENINILKKINKLKKEAKKIKYDVVIAIDHRSLNYLGKIYKNKTRLVFWSFDIIYYDENRYSSFLIKKMIKNNKKNIQYFDLIVVQDKERGFFIDSLLTCSNIKKIYLPVALKEDEFSIKIAEIKRNKEIKDIPPVIIQMGGYTGRGSLDLLSQVRGKNLSIIIKGRADNATFNYIDSDLILKKQVEIKEMSNDFISMRKDISIADIGFIAYKVRDINHLFIEKASGQLVEFIKMGIPVISCFADRLNDFINDNKIGVGLSNIDGFSNAVEEIIKKYSFFSMNSRNMFLNNFNLYNMIKELEKNLLLV